MPKLLRILVPLVVLGAVLAVPTTASAQTATTCGAGAWAVDDPTSPLWLDCPAPRENYKWLSSVVRSNTATQSDFAFTSRNIDGVRRDYVVAGNYAGFRIFDVTDPTDPVLKSDTPCGGSQGDITMVGNLIFRSSDGSHNVPFGDLNRACETSGNENQRVTLDGFDADGDSFQLRFQNQNGQTIVRGGGDAAGTQPFTAQGIANSIAGGNEIHSVALSGYDTDGESFRLVWNGNASTEVIRGRNNTTAGIAAVLQGGNEVQTVTLTNYTVNGRSYTLHYGGNDSIPIVRGTNNTAAGIQQAILGVDEQQQVVLSNFDAANAGNAFRVRIGGNLSSVLGNGGAAISNANVAAAINGIAGFAGTVSVTGAGNSGFTATFAGASAKTDVGALEIVFEGSADEPPTGCTTADPACSAAVNELVKGRAPLHPDLAGATVTVGGLADTGYTLTFSGTHAQTNIGDFSVTNGTDGVTGTVRETVRGTAPVSGWPAGATVTIAGLSDNGFTVTYAGSLANTNVSNTALAVAGESGDVSGTVSLVANGAAAMAGWLAGGTAAVSNLSDAGFNVTFAGNYAAADVSMLSVVNGTGGVTGTVVEQAKGTPGVGFVGMYIFDATDLENPTFLKAVPVCGGGHTHTVYDDKANNRVVVYMTRSGTTGTVPGFGVSCAGLPSNRLTAVTVPKNNPTAARIASENIVYPGSGGCHDTNVFEEKKRILTACLGSGVAMLDISDPLNATTVWGPFTWPNHGTWHTGSWSWSGKYVYVNGEPGGGNASECAFDDHPAKPTVFALHADTGALEGTWTLPRPQENTAGASNCTVHNLNVLPLANKNVLAHSFYTAGASIIDFTNPKAPREVAFVDQVVLPGETSGAGCWSAYWYNGTIFCNELSWGLHLFDVDLPWWDDTMTLQAHNAQTVTNYIRCQVSFTGGPARAGQTGTVTARAKLYGPAPLQAAKDTKVRISGPGFNRLVTTNRNGVARATVKATKRGAINVAVRAADNLNITGGCAAPSKAVARKVAR